MPGSYDLLMRWHFFVYFDSNLMSGKTQESWCKKLTIREIGFVIPSDEQIIRLSLP